MTLHARQSQQGVLRVGFAAAGRHEIIAIDHCPILDPAIFKRQTFTTATVGGAFLRFAMGASPFLLALLLQLGFGMSAFHAGLTTLAAAAGSFGMKTCAPPLIRRFGFKRILIGNGLIAAALYGAQALLRPDTPYALIFFTLFISGFFRSLQFTGINALSYSDINEAAMRNASTFSAMMQQLSLSIGAGTAALALHMTLAQRDGTVLQASDFQPAYLFIGGIVMALAAAGGVVGAREQPRATDALQLRQLLLQAACVEVRLAVLQR